MPSKGTWRCLFWMLIARLPKGDFVKLPFLAIFAEDKMRLGNLSEHNGT